MSRRNKLWLTSTGLFAVLTLSAILILQSAWFADFVREKVISAVENSTGGKVEIESFQFDWSHLTVRIRNFILHGTEPRTASPLVRASSLELRLKLLSGFKKAVDLQYLGIQSPQVNLIVNPDGTTNIPKPKVASKPSQTSGLETVVDLAVGRFEIDEGLLQYSQRKISFGARGEQLRALLSYDAARPRYAGTVSIDPLRLTSGNNPPLEIHVRLPVSIEKDTVTLSGAAFNSGQSKVQVNASVRNLNAPVIAASMQAAVSLPEMQRSFGLPIAVQGNVPNLLSADLAARTDQNSNEIQVQSAHVVLGQTNFEASGTMVRGTDRGVQFHGSLALAELSRLFKMASTAITGDVQLNGSAKLDAQNNYSIDGALHSRGLSLRDADTHIPSVALDSPFHADPHLISMDRLEMNTLGGGVAARIVVQDLRQLSVEGNVRSLPLPALGAALTSKPVGYDGTVNGPFSVKGDLRAKGTTGYRAQARLNITPGSQGVAVSGQLNPSYDGARGTIDIQNSFVGLPHSRIDLTGSLNKQLEIKLLSRNLNDFLPAANFGAAKPLGSFPIVLDGGTATLQAQVTGKLSAPQINSYLEMGRFAAQKRVFERLALDVSASPSGATIQNGELNGREFHGKTLRTDFSGSLGLRKWQPLPASPLVANLQMRNADLADLASLAGQASVRASGQLSADVNINGTYGNPLGAATLEVANGSAYDQPFQRLQAGVSLTDQLITLSNVQLDAAGGQLKLDGTFQHPRDSFTVGHAQFRVFADQLQLANLSTVKRQDMGIAGLLQLTANGAADVVKTNGETAVMVSDVTADLSAKELRVHNEAAGSFTAKARTAGGNVNYDAASNFAGSDIRVNGHTTLAKNYPTTVDASIQHLSVEKTLQLAGQAQIPARGDLSADAHVTGSLDSPDAKLNFTLSDATLYSEPVNRLRGSLHYSDILADIPSLQLDTPAGSISLAGSFSHPAGDLKRGALQLHVSSNDVQLGRIEHVRDAQPGLTGTLRLAADVSASLNPGRQSPGRQSPDLLISSLTADASTAGLRLNRRDLGSASFTAKTSGSNLEFQLDSNIAGSQIHGAGQSQLVRGYPLRASWTFANIRYSNFAPLLSSGGLKPSFEALVEGKGSIEGSAQELQKLSGRLQLDRVEAGTDAQLSATGGPALRAVQFQNNGPVVVTLKSGVVHLDQLHLQGPRSSLKASGEADLNTASAPLRLTVDANGDLGVLQDMNRDFYSSGGIVVNAVVRGSFTKPLVNGRVELKNANVNYSGSPNGLSNGNGVIALNGTTATIQNLTGESGGGKVSLSGFVGFGTSLLSYNLRATANSVRVRYADISLTSNASLSLTGNSRRSLLGGTVTINRLAYSSSSDVGSLLSATSKPPTSAAEAPSGLLAGIRLDIRVVTAPDLHVVTTYAERLEVSSNLRIRGSAVAPGVLGRVRVTSGQLVFFGNTYTVNSGSIDFYNPNVIEPVLNVSLETSAQGVDVSIGVSGPMSELKLSYRSDPPLTFEQIVQLLATNTTPADATIASHQPAPPQQSVSQMGGSAILGQAVANPLASRVQRVFGLTQFKIDPTLSGNNGQPSARVTLQQKIANNITFTYTTDVTQTNSELVRVQWDMSSAFSAVALRDFNGNVSVQFLYKFKKR
ncbi:MAG TPA: translocation/assembly module TamB domain-containing protein [Bryobacteraceae bacterium]|nr:translocation/assembly module TamB domain-containing protein [Bryobacteraceae bacterium]